MTDAIEPTADLEIKSDADWKRQVKEEAAALDAQLQAERSHPSGESAAAKEPWSADNMKMPPADFTTLVTMFSTQAMVSLGVLPDPISGQPDQNLMLARHFIDLLGVLQEKTRRNLTGHESNLLEQSLHELRLAYVELSQQPTADDVTPTS